jgi:ferredoxin
MRVQVDAGGCEANGVCAGLVPEVFALDDDDSLRVLAGDVPAELLAAVQLAVRSCPKAALRMTE